MAMIQQEKLLKLIEYTDIEIRKFSDFTWPPDVSQEFIAKLAKNFVDLLEGDNYTDNQRSEILRLICAVMAICI